MISKSGAYLDFWATTNPRAAAAATLCYLSKSF